MTKFLWAAITIVSSIAFSNQSAVAQFTDNFSDEDFTTNPAWEGNDSKFSISSGQLKLSATAEAGNAFLSTKSSAITNASWEFSVGLQFNPSGSNYARVYLVSDQQDLSGPLNGYYVLIGNTTDEVSLYLQNGQAHKKIIDGFDARVDLSLVEVTIKVTRDENGNWELFSDVGLMGTYTLEGTVTDPTHTSSNYFGISCAYTATRSDKFFFDDFEIAGQPLVDNTVKALYKDVIITEIFADPSPSVGLPEIEFIEIFNKTSNEFNLNNWTLSDGTSTALIANKILLPGEYLLVVPFSSIEEFSFIENVIGVSNFPSLNNAADNIILKSQPGITIDSIQYSDTWYRDTQKKAGGWALEIIDLYNPCGEEDNWIASEDDEGGTPGKQNSVFANKPDLYGPNLVQVTAHSSSEVVLKFNEKLASEEVSASSVVFNPTLQIQSIYFSDNSLRSITVKLTSTIEQKQLYSVAVNAVRDCNLNVINEDGQPFFFAMPEQADSLDVVINEILFDPWPTGVDFIELYNSSPKFINLKNWSLANWDEDGIVNVKKLTEKDVLILPGNYVVLTSDPNTVIGQYPQSAESIFLQTYLPSLPDDEGSIALINEQGKIIDAITYYKDFQSPLLKNEEGVSLERISPITSSQDVQNWKSASTVTGYATPGFLNSNSRLENSSVTTSVKVDPEIFQPIFGQPNFTQIMYKFDQGGFVGNVKIYDGHGRLVKTLANNEILGSEGFYHWNGDQDGGAKARTGYYFVWFEVFDLAGTIHTFRNRIIIVGQY